MRPTARHRPAKASLRLPQCSARTVRRAVRCCPHAATERSLPASGTVQRLGVLRLQELLGGWCQPGKPLRREWPQTWPRKDGMGRRKRRNWSQDPLRGLNEASIGTVDRIQAVLFLWLIQHLPACLALNLSALDVLAHLMLIKSFGVGTIIIPQLIEMRLKPREKDLFSTPAGEGQSWGLNLGCLALSH